MVRERPEPKKGHAMHASVKRVATIALMLGVAVSLPAACGDSGDSNPDNGSSSSGIGGGIIGGCTVAGQQCPVACDPDLGCVECASNADCGATQPICVSGQCEECGETSDCATGQACFPEDHTCQAACGDNTDCSGNAPICDPLTGACVGCMDDTDCPAQAPICSPVTAQCVECGMDADCG